MEARINRLLFVICVACLVSAGFAQQPEPNTPNESNSPAVSYPYVARITADNVNIRSGPDIKFYVCGKLAKGDTVTVVDSPIQGWARIVPPAGQFSWISMRFVNPDPNNPGTGIVNSNDVRVYVGSDTLDPIRSTRWQLTLSKGDTVKFLGENKNDYFKIEPPAGAYRWINTTYLEAVSGVMTTMPPDVAVTPQVSEANGTIALPKPITVTVAEPARLEKYYVLQKQLDAERRKPIEQQNYDKIEKQFLDLASSGGESDKAARYAQFALKQIERFKLALQIAKNNDLQNEQIKERMQAITDSSQKRLDELPQFGQYAMVGTLQTSSIYGAGNSGPVRYVVRDTSGRILCYAMPVGPAATADLGKFIGKKVGLVGQIIPNPQSGGTLVKFSSAVVLK
jgi:hypothetical protein